MSCTLTYSQIFKIKMSTTLGVINMLTTNTKSKKVHSYKAAVKNNISNDDKIGRQVEISWREKDNEGLMRLQDWFKQ